MYGYVYLTENLINHRKYIGQHKSKRFDENYKGSGVLLRRAVEKYGWENFDCKILRECDTREELNSAEKELIEVYNAIADPTFYNIAKGGEGGDTVTGMSDEDRKKFADKSRERWANKSYRIKVTDGLRNSWKDITYKKVVSEKISSALIGKSKSDEHRRKISEARIRNGSAAGENNPMYGVKRTSPTKGYHYYTNSEIEVYTDEGTYESTYKSQGFVKGRLQSKLDALHKDLSKRLRGNTYTRGKIRIHKNDLEKCIKPEDLDKFLADGWAKGRRPK